MKKLKEYMILLVDRKKAKIFTLIDGIVERKENIDEGNVHQRVKANDIHYYGRSNKIARHIENQLHRRLQFVAQKTANFAKKGQFEGILIGSHKPLFSKIAKHLPYPINQQVKGTFITELKGPFNKILQNAKNHIQKIELGEKG